MNIQPLSIVQNYKTSFGQNNSRRFEDASILKKQSINATLYDLYQMEDRLEKQNADLFAKQNKLIGNALDRITRVAYLTTDNSDELHKEFDQAIKNTDILTHNGKDPYPNRTYSV